MTWTKVAIGDLGRVVTGDTPPRKRPEYYGDAYPFIKPTDMTVGQRLTIDYDEGYSEEGFSKYRKKLIPAGATAVVTIGSIGQKLTWLHRDCFVNQAVNAVIPDPAKFDSLYVYYLLKHNLSLVKQADTGASSGRENVSKYNFSALAVLACLDLPTQKRIAEVLDAVDSSIETNQRRIALLEDSARRLYREWFVHLRFPGHELGPMKDGVPRGWAPAAFSDLVEVNPRTRFEKGVERPFVEMAALSERAMVIGERSRRPIGGGAKFKNGDTLFARITPCTENGKTGFVQFLEDDDAVASGSTEFIVFRSARVNPWWVYCLSREDHFREHAIRSMTGSDGRQRVNPKCFDKFMTLQPPVDLLVDFGCAVADSFEQIELLCRQQRLLIEARDLLLPKLMSGKLDVSSIRLTEEATT